VISHTSGSLNNDILEQIKDSLEELMIQMEASRRLYMLKPPEKGFDYHWFYDAKTKILERFNTNIQVEIIEDYDDDNYLCMYKDKSVIIKKDVIGQEVEH
tara:strand:- start:232 stop:531 length:300 start_codon:yes stop_codon:yes gene_type:complete